MNDTQKQKGQKKKKTTINNREKQYDYDADMTFELYSNVGVKDNNYNAIVIY